MIKQRSCGCPLFLTKREDKPLRALSTLCIAAAKRLASWLNGPMGPYCTSYENHFSPSVPPLLPDAMANPGHSLSNHYPPLRGYGANPAAPIVPTSLSHRLGPPGPHTPTRSTRCSSLRSSRGFPGGWAKTHLIGVAQRPTNVI
jgi:hypothetical protein